MVVSDAALATRVGVATLARGGNAVDAAVATAFALAVVLPKAGNVGGGGLLVLTTADGHAEALDFRETAPAAATRAMFGTDPDTSVTGPLAAGVPGSVAGLFEVHRRFGRLPWAELVAPAIDLAERGFAVDEDFASAVKEEAARLARFAASVALFLPGGRPLAEGVTWRNPDLAVVLRRIAADGPAGFYAGETADMIEAEMHRSGGIMTRADLAAYQPRWREPIQFTYRGHRVISMPPPSSGGLVLALIANILAPYDLKALGWHTPAEIHLVTEAMRRAFAARNATLGDPDFVAIPRDLFLSDEAASRLRASIVPDRATPSADVAAPSGMGAEGHHTTHLSVVDADGGAVALTTTVNTSFGSAVTVTGAGFVLNNEMDDFTAHPGQPNAFGLVQGETNAVAPGKRPLSSMTPTIVMDSDGKVLLVTGAAGGPTIITAVFQVLINVVDYHMDIAAAVAAPRFHHQHLPDELVYEEGQVPADVLKALGARGHRLATRPAIGDAPSILRRGGVWTGAAETRHKGGLALGL